MASTLSLPLLRRAGARALKPAVLVPSWWRVGRRGFADDSGPLLEGFKVVELANVLAGPSVGQFLAELGADVVKIENKRTKGDVTRGWKLKGETGTGPSAYFSCCNTGKRSIALDGGHARGRELTQKLCEQADVVVASYKPGDAEKLGVDPATLMALNPRLIYAQITGYGLDSKRVGYDALVQAEAGFTFINGEPDGKPTKMPVALVDLLAAHQLKEAILCAVIRRGRTGKGSAVNVSLYAAATASLANQATGWLVAGKVPQRMGSEHPSIFPYGAAFDDKDGNPVTLAVGSDGQFKQLCAELGIPDVAEDPKFKKNVDRVLNKAELGPLIVAAFAKRDRKELLEALTKRSVPAGAIADMPTVFSLPQAEALVFREDAAGASVGGTGQAVGLKQCAWLGDSVHAHHLHRPPRYGEHTVEILQEVLHISATEVEELVKENVVEGSA